MRNWYPTYCKHAINAKKKNYVLPHLVSRGDTYQLSPHGQRLSGIMCLENEREVIPTGWGRKENDSIESKRKKRKGKTSGGGHLSRRRPRASAVLVLCATVRRGGLVRDPARKRGRAAKYTTRARRVRRPPTSCWSAGYSQVGLSISMPRSQFNPIQSFFSGMDIPIWPACCGFSLPCDGLSAVWKENW